ncbi:hypothetical protein TRFO_01575 [Tritrichomonas foetus]|uniref:Uncharacterized protein n=1 Tax=Tritrichomonas foetus TaxID=1144522 RepID=A0A1J4K2Y5_9EUKA|nr:hypothetical protein TRFO_01575 [Tritrichomonas foetus]|eukprot:OHT03853.1 hypothetical protein TRFO_01575 [Tritrichomonas foetus]
MGKAQRKRKMNKINIVVSQQRRHQRQQHMSTITQLRQRFVGLDPDLITSTKHPLETTSYMKNMLNPLQRAMVFCMNYCGGYASDDELEAFCSVYWKAIEAASDRRMGYAGLPNKRIFKIIFSIKKNGVPLFVPCPTDESKHGPYVPQQLFHDRIIDFLRIHQNGAKLSEIAENLEPFKNENGFFIDLETCERRVRATLFLYRHQGHVIFDEDQEVFILREHYQTRTAPSSTLPKFLIDLNINNMTPGQLYDEIKKRKNNLANSNSNSGNENQNNSKNSSNLNSNDENEQVNLEKKEKLNEDQE